MFSNTQRPVRASENLPRQEKTENEYDIKVFVDEMKK